MAQTSRVQNFLQIFLFVLLLAAPCMAQKPPTWEVFAGYSVERSYVREYYKSTPIIYTFRNQYANLKGWETSVTENVNRWFGGTLDLSGHYKTPQLLGTNNQERIYSILYGPRFSFRRPWGIPFAHVMLGAAHTNVKVIPVGPHASDLSFAMAAGGGLDISFRNNAIRLFQADYSPTNALGIRRNNFRISAGVVFYLEKEK